jgi:hypothetical protein
MVMIFADENARRQLLEKGVVYTLRVRKHKEGRDWITDKRGGRKICDVKVEFVEGIRLSEQLIKYVGESGFEHIWDWCEAIRRLNPKMKKIEGYLYKVTKL